MLKLDGGDRVNRVDEAREFREFREGAIIIY